MIVAVEEGLKEVKEGLRSAGHQVVPLYGYTGAVDAAVFCDAPLIRIQPESQNFSDKNRGIFMLSARGLSVGEVLSRLEQKSIDGIGLF